MISSGHLHGQNRHTNADSTRRRLSKISSALSAAKERLGVNTQGRQTHDMDAPEKLWKNLRFVREEVRNELADRGVTNNGDSSVTSAMVQKGSLEEVAAIYASKKPGWAQMRNAQAIGLAAKKKAKVTHRQGLLTAFRPLYLSH